MLKLITYQAAFGAPSASPFGVKAMCLLNMAGVPYETKFSDDPRKAPKNKLPMLVDGDQVIADSDFIRVHLETNYGANFDAGLSARDRAISRAVIRMVDEHIYFALVCDRWLNDKNWAHVKAIFFNKIPVLVRGVITKMIRNKARGQAMAQGMGRHSTEEQLARIDADLTAISTLIGKQAFLFGDTPTAADASTMPMLQSIAGSPTQTKLSKRINDDPVLSAYIKRAAEAML